MELVLQNKTLASLLKLGEHSESLVRGETGGEYSCTQLGGGETLL